MIAVSSTITPAAVLRQATRYVDRGWQVVPIPVRTKRPILDGWPQLRLKPEELPQHFGRRPSNIGVILGHVSGNLVDIDLDCDEAVKMAPKVLTPTATFGRLSRPSSHWLYVSADAEYLKCVDPISFKDEAGHDNFQTLVELRTNAAGKTPGLQTVFPPSQHSTTGESIEWDASVDPAHINVTAQSPADLRARVMRLAAVCLVMRHARDADAKSAWLANPTETPPPIPSEAIPKFREWMGLSPPAPVRQKTVRPQNSSSDFDDAVATYNRANARTYPAECSPCPICTSPDGFKASSAAGRWACFSARHSQFKERGVEGAGGMFTGDALDLDAFAWNRTRAEQLREGGYLATRPQPVLTVVAPSTAAHPAAPVVEDDPESEWKPFPTDALPEPLRSYVRQAAPATKADECMVAMELMSLLASCIGTTRSIKLKGQWKEPCALWCIIVCGSGQKKTPVFVEVTGLLSAHIERATQEHAAAMDVYKREVTHQRENRKQLGNVEPPEFPKARRFRVEDITREKMISLLQDNPRGLLLANDEISGWFKSFGAYKSGLGGDESSWLKMYNGSTLDSDRKGGPPENQHIHVKRALVSITGGIQPEILKGNISADSINAGLLARFMVAMPPRRRGGWTSAEIDPRCRAAVGSVVDWLLALRDSGDGPVEVPLSHDALNLWINWVNGIASAIHESPHPSIQASLSKIEGVAARVALLIHMVRAGAGEDVDQSVVDAESLSAALRIAFWFADEGARVYSEMGWTNNSAKTLEVKLLTLLRAAPAGLTVTELHRSTSNKHKGTVMRETLERMEAARKVKQSQTAASGVGKPVVRWSAVMEPQAAG
jgi:hypothetical protein